MFRPSLRGAIRVRLSLHTPSQSNDPLLNSLVDYLFVGLRRAGLSNGNKMAVEGARGVPGERSDVSSSSLYDIMARPGDCNIEMKGKNETNDVDGPGRVPTQHVYRFCYFRYSIQSVVSTRRKCTSETME